MKPIQIRRAHLHNLKAIDVDIPADKLVVVTGVSGSGKSTLVFDLLFEEGRRRYLKAIGVLSDLGQEQGAESISGLRPTVAVKQGITRRSNPRSVVGTRTGLLHYFGMLYADTYNQTLSDDEAVNASHFSFNSPLGMCHCCQGRGYEYSFNFSVLLPDSKTTLPELYRNANMDNSFKKFSEKIANRFKLDLKKPFIEFPDVVKNIVLYGQDPDGVQLSGLDINLQSRLLRGKNINNAMLASLCSVCHGSRLTEEASAVLLGGKSFGEIANLPLVELFEFIQSVNRNENQKKQNLSSSRKRIVSQITETITRLIDIKLGYLTLYRPVPTLSGGEIQRLFLHSFLDSDLESIIYIFDEPTTGLHEIEKRELLEKLFELKDQGNSVILVEHDSYSIAMAEHIIDIGPLAGIQGGEVVFQGSYKAILNSRNSLTGEYLSGKRQLPVRALQAVSTDGAKALRLQRVRTNNLKSVCLTLPLGKMIGVAGVSGSGKSSLVADTLVPVLQQKFDNNRAARAGEESPAVINLSKPKPLFESILGVELLSRCVQVGQEPIGRRIGSNPATYLGIWDRVRRNFAQTNDAKKRGYTAGHFSFNALGACKICGGSGKHQQWLGSMWMSYQCDGCKGQRYEADVLEVLYKGKSITQVLACSATEAIALFADDRPIVRMLNVLVRTGMGYLTLGQETSTLSGGEAQRLKLAKELGRGRVSTNTLFVLDEPSTGLSLHDVAQLMALLDELVVQGNTVLIVEHDPNVLSRCDWLVELGPGAGTNGGNIIAQGTPQALKANVLSIVGQFLEPVS